MLKKNIGWLEKMKTKRALVARLVIPSHCTYAYLRIAATNVVVAAPLLLQHL